MGTRSAARGITQATDLVPMGAAPAAGGEGVVLNLQHHPTGTDQTRTVDWVVCAVHQRAEDSLYKALRAAAGPATDTATTGTAATGAAGELPFTLDRVGDCLSPRRAHAAVVEGQRAAVAL